MKLNMGGITIDCAEPRVGMRAAQDVSVQLPGAIDIVGVGALAGQEAIILAPPDGR